MDLRGTPHRGHRRHGIPRTLHRGRAARARRARDRRGAEPRRACPSSRRRASSSVRPTWRERDRLAAGFAGAKAVVSNAALFALSNQTLGRRTSAPTWRARGTSWRACEDGGRRGASCRCRRSRCTGSSRKRHASTRTRRSSAPTRGGCRGTSIRRRRRISEQEAWRLAQRARPRADDGSPVHHLRRVRPELHAGLQARHGAAGERSGRSGSGMSYVYAGDVAEGIALALEQDDSIGRAYNLTGDGETWQDLADGVEGRRRQGRRRWRCPIPHAARSQVRLEPRQARARLASAVAGGRSPRDPSARRRRLIRRCGSLPKGRGGDEAAASSPQAGMVLGGEGFGLLRGDGGARPLLRGWPPSGRGGCAP